MAKTRPFVTEDDIELWNLIAEDFKEATDEPPIARLDRITRVLKANTKKKLRRVI